jgi:adenylylsulfate kinase-like enzyme
MIIWLYGLSGSGKSTLGRLLDHDVSNSPAGHRIIHLDGDDMREGLCKDLGFGINDRRENIRRIAEVARLFDDEGYTVVVTAITPFKEMRTMLAEEYGVHLVWCDSVLSTCIKRDVKGLYAAGTKNMTGTEQPFDRELEEGCLVLDTDEKTVAECYAELKGLWTVLRFPH